MNPAILREMVRGPGADDRIWCRHVVLTTEPVVEAGGVYAQGRVEPEGISTTVRLRPLYVGPGVGIYLPHAKGDLLVCVFPSGCPGGGAVEVAPLPSDEDPVPAAVQQKPLDLWVIAGGDKDIRIWATGSGVLELKASMISLVTTGQAATSKVFIDGVNWFAQWQTPMGPTIGPPVSSPAGPNVAALTSWKAGEGI